ncbi:hypothetical protein BASA62_000925 [Batrachochytrium salamandrivorans]|nr:hypothetical protein BASA62_000925 [Batrachochytrium salamandrivorans]
MSLDSECKRTRLSPPSPHHSLYSHHNQHRPHDAASQPQGRSSLLYNGLGISSIHPQSHDFPSPQLPQHQRPLPHQQHPNLQEQHVDPHSLLSCPKLQQILSAKNEVSDRVRNNKELAYVIESSPQIVHFFQLIQMDRISDRLDAIEQKLARIDHLERSLEKAMTTTPTTLQISSPCLVELKAIASRRMNGVRGAPYHCENENKEILGGKKLLVPKTSSQLFLPSMSSLDEWARVMFDARSDEPTLDQLARAAFLRFFRDHGHLLQTKLNGDNPTLACSCQNAYEHLPALHEYHAKKSSQAHIRLVTSFAKKNWLLSGFWREFDRAIDEVYQHSFCDRVVQQVIEIDRENYTTNSKAHGSMDGVHLVPPRDKPSRRSTDTSILSLAPSSVSYDGIRSYCSPAPVDEDWFSQSRGDDDS